MAIISVEGKSLGAELAVWGVPHNYAVAFAEKSTSKNGRIALHPFFFNDTEHIHADKRNTSQTKTALHRTRLRFLDR